MLQGFQSTWSYYSYVFGNPTTAIPMPQDASTCSGSGCSAYFFPGSLLNAQPLPKNISGSNFDVLTVNNALGLQTSFSDVDPSEEMFSVERDCVTLGDNSTAMVMCIRNSTVTQDSLVAGSSPMK